MKEQQIVEYVIDKSFQEVYEVENDHCPICQEKFLTLCNVVKLGSVAYHLGCFHETTNLGVNLK